MRNRGRLKRERGGRKKKGKIKRKEGRETEIPS